MVITASGTVSFDRVLMLLKDVCEAAAENHVDKILVDSLAVDGELATFERYRLGAELAAYLTQRQFRVKLAFVGTSPALTGFGAQIARNHGIATDVFPSIEEARNWLEDLGAAKDLESAVL